MPVLFSIFHVLWRVYHFETANLGARSTICSTFTLQGNANSHVEIGPGNLKLQFSADEGNLIQYTNCRNLVSVIVFGPFDSWSDICFLTSL